MLPSQGSECSQVRAPKAPKSVLRMLPSQGSECSQIRAPNAPRHCLVILVTINLGKEKETGLKFKTETSEVLHFEHSIVW
jgi:hypothetical protein